MPASSAWRAWRKRPRTFTNWRVSRRTWEGAIRNILTFDVEDWYHGLDIPTAHWPSFEKRLDIGLGLVLDMLAHHQTQATFFVLGAAAHQHPQWIRRIAQAGHEIGTHGWTHTPIYRQCPQQFRGELYRSVRLLQDLTSQPMLGHRAAFFSITKRSLWALDELASSGLHYDSSIFPAHNYRYGMPGAQCLPHRLSTHPLWELPISTMALGCLRLPFGGGFYARFWPYALLRCAITHLNALGQPAILYFHPWEFDAEQPRLRTGSHWLARATHYHRLPSTRNTLQALLTDFEWTSALDFVR